MWHPKNVYWTGLVAETVLQHVLQNRLFVLKRNRLQNTDRENTIFYRRRRRFTDTISHVDCIQFDDATTKPRIDLTFKKDYLSPLHQSMQAI